jgi:hypothetical protein
MTSDNVAVQKDAAPSSVRSGVHRSASTDDIAFEREIANEERQRAVKGREPVIKEREAIRAPLTVLAGDF